MCRGLSCAGFLFVLLVHLARAQSPAPAHVIVVVVDGSGAAISGAAVEFRAGSAQSRGRTDEMGQFAFDLANPTLGGVTVHAPGFRSKGVSWTGQGQLRIVLDPDSATQHALVTATRINAQLEDSPSDSFAFAREYLSTTPALTLDDALRKVPGFTLFRRSSSRTANPGTQGASMRGLGASGASRSLVLVDDVPLIDPFGGWVYWDRVGRESIESVEVVRGGGGASLYGSTAMGGIVQLRTRRPEAPEVSVEGSWGNEKTPEVSAWVGTEWHQWIASLATDLFQTDGYIPVQENQRGSVDAPANSRHALNTVDLGRELGEKGRVFVRASYFDEARHNGTAAQTNSTRLADFSTGWNSDFARFGTISARMFGLFESYDQTFSSVSSDRNSESLTNHQFVPSQALGGNAQWSKPVGRWQTLVGGFEMREVHGSSNENLFLSGTPNGRNLSGGRERTARLFGEDIVQVGRMTANVSFGYDHWSDFDARRIHFNADQTLSLTAYPARTSDALNPRAALLYRAGHGTSLVASAYRAFRAPTLNELYRSFRQGNVVTSNNPALRAEHLTGIEAGVRQTLLTNRLNVRATFFWNDMTNTVVNVTIKKDPDLITRQKQNIGRTLSTGLNVDGEFRVAGNLQLAGGYQYTHAVVSSFTPDPNVGELNPDLVGKWIPQVPHQQFTLQGRYVNPRAVTVTVQGTFSGQQFDDDLNSLPLDRYFSVDAYVSRTLGKGFQGFVAVENMFNMRWAVAATPVTTLGPPLLARVGLRYDFGRK